MSELILRRFDTATDEPTIQFGDHEIFLTPGVQASEGGPKLVCISVPAH